MGGFGSAFFDDEGESYSFGNGSNWDYDFDEWIPAHILSWVKEKGGTAQRRVYINQDGSKTPDTDIYIKLPSKNRFWINVSASIAEIEAKKKLGEKEIERREEMCKFAFEGKFIQVKVSSRNQLEVNGKFRYGFNCRRISPETVSIAKKLNEILENISTPSDLEEKIEACNHLIQEIFKDDPSSVLSLEEIKKVDQNPLRFFSGILFPEAKKKPTPKKIKR